LIGRLLLGLVFLAQASLVDAGKQSMTRSDKHRNPRDGMQAQGHELLLMSSDGANLLRTQHPNRLAT